MRLAISEFRFSDLGASPRLTFGPIRDGTTMTRTTQVRLISLFLIFASGRSVLGQALPAHPLTLDEAIDYALAHYPAVRAALEQVESARYGVALARTSYLPQVNPIY